MKRRNDVTPKADPSNASSSKRCLSLVTPSPHACGRGGSCGGAATAADDASAAAPTPAAHTTLGIRELEGGRTLLVVTRDAFPPAPKLVLSSTELKCGTRLDVVTRERPRTARDAEAQFAAKVREMVTTAHPSEMRWKMHGEAFYVSRERWGHTLEMYFNRE